MTQDKNKAEFDRLTSESMGYGDPQAQLIDDRKLQILLNQELKKSITQINSEIKNMNDSSTRIGSRLNLLSLLMVLVALLNVAVLLYQTLK